MYFATPAQVAAPASMTSATDCRLSANARPLLMYMSTNSPASTAAAMLRSGPASRWPDRNRKSRSRGHADPGENLWRDVLRQRSHHPCGAVSGLG